MGRMTDQEIMVADDCRWLHMTCCELWISMELINTHRSSEIHNSQQAFLKYYCIELLLDWKLLY